MELRILLDASGWAGDGLTATDTTDPAQTASAQFSVAVSQPGDGVPPGMTLAQANWFYENTFAEPAQVAPDWNGSVVSDDPGTLGTDYLNAIAARIDAYRWMAGLPGGITLDATENANAQQAALMMSATSSWTIRPRLRGLTTRPRVTTVRRIPI